MSPPRRESRPGGNATETANGSAERTTQIISAQQVAWWTVHEFVAPLLTGVGFWPMAGTPAWCDLEDGPVKWAALLDAAQHWVLRVETCQEAHCDASRQVGKAAWDGDEGDEPVDEDHQLTWSALSREILVRTEFYAARPWLRRVAS